jgi:hypothetical protein
MLRSWSLSLLSVVLVLASTALARAEENLPGTQDQIDTLKRQVTELERRMVSVAVLDERFGALKAEVAAMRQQLADIQETLRRLEKARDPMRSYIPEAPRIGTLLLTGSLRVMNLSGFDATVRLNSTTVEVPAGQTVPLPAQPSGALVYEVWATPFGVLQSPVTRILRPGDPLTITIYPR